MSRIITVTSNMNINTEELIKNILENIGEDPNRDGLLETPKRVAKMYEEIFSGYSIQEKDIFKVFDGEKYEGIIEVKDIYFSSFCEHHMIPFFGKVHISYKPNGNIVGLSKLARLVELYAHRLQVQERLTNQIATSIMLNLQPKGCKVIIEAEHLCISMRGVNKPGAITKTVCQKGSIDI